MEEVKRTSMMHILIFWVIGISYWLLEHLFFQEIFSTSTMIASLLLLICLLLTCIALLIKSILTGWQDYRSHTPQPRFFNFLFSEASVSFEDERSQKINMLASQKSYIYAEAFVFLLLLIGVVTGQRLLKIETVISCGLITITLRQLAYYLIWRNEYLK